MSEPSSATTFKALIASLHSALPGNYWQKRVSMAWLGGYLDAKHMVYMMQTFGFPLWAYVDHSRKMYPAIPIPWMMLEHELLCIGKSKSSIDSLFIEIRVGLKGETA